MSQGIFDTRRAYKLDDPGRIRELKPYKLLESQAGVIKGMTGIDLGSGTGAFALPMAELVGSEGKVYAVDNSARMLEHIRLKNPPPNLMPVFSDVEHTGLNDQMADLCLLAFILHEVKKPGNLIAEAFRLLKPGGRIVIVEWNADLDSPGPPRRKRISQEQIERMFGQAGFSMMGYTEWTQKHYVAIGRK